jgi:hypothetical protein
VAGSATPLALAAFGEEGRQVAILPEHGVIVDLSLGKWLSLSSPPLPT